MCKIEDVFVLVLLILCSISDIRRRGVYTWILISMSILLLIFCAFCRQQEIGSVVGGALIGGFFVLISRISKEAIGYADSWLIVLLGGYLGFCGVVTLLTIAFVITGLAGLIGLVFHRLRRNSTVPFIPFLTAAYVGVMLL